MIEPYKIKVVEPIRLIPKEERKALLKKAHYNTFNLPAHSVYIDLVSDSGTSALSAKAWAEIISADETFAYQKSYFKLIETAKDLFGFPYILIVHQGRMGEHIIFKFLVKQGGYVVANTMFETTQANIEYYGGKGINLPGELGNIDLDKLSDFINKVSYEKISFVLLTLINNQLGGWHISLENIKECKALLSKYNIPLWLDGARWAENMYFIKGNLSIKEMTKLVFSYADGFFLSAKKSGLSSIGGLIGVRDESILKKLEEFAMAIDGFTSHGGMSSRDIAAMTQGLLEAVDDAEVEFRMQQLSWFGRLFKDIPILKPIGGIGVYIKANSMLPQLKPNQFPAMALAGEAYIEGGIRGAPWGEFFRLALPRRVYTNNQLHYAYETIAQVFKRRKQIKGLKPIYIPEKLGSFNAKFKPYPTTPNI